MIPTMRIHAAVVLCEYARHAAKLLSPPSVAGSLLVRLMRPVFLRSAAGVNLVAYRQTCLLVRQVGAACFFCTVHSIVI